MSSSENLADLIQTIQILTRGNYIGLAVFTVTMYDWFLTFSDEVRIMWTRPVTGAKVLFLLNRYIFIAYYITAIMDNFESSASNRSCSNIGISINVFVVLHNLVVSVFQVLRVYAISGRKWSFALIVIAFNIFPTFYNIYLWAKNVFIAAPPPLSGCDTLVSISESAYNNLTLVTRGCLIAADLIIVVVTIYHTRGTVRASRNADIQASFSSVLLHAGILYFAVMLVMNITEFIVLQTTDVDYFGYFPAMFDYLLISHFLLNLQNMSSVLDNGLDPARSTFVRSTQGQTSESSIRFADHILGNLGESLRDTHEDEEDMDDGCTVPHSDVGTESVSHSRSEEECTNMWEKNLPGSSKLPSDVVHVRSAAGMTISETIA